VVKLQVLGFTLTLRNYHRFGQHSCPLTPQAREWLAPGLGHLRPRVCLSGISDFYTTRRDFLRYME